MSQVETHDHPFICLAVILLAFAVKIAVFVGFVALAVYVGKAILGI